MIPALTEDMVDGMDDTAGLLPPHPRAAPHSAFFWNDGTPSALGAKLRPPTLTRNLRARSDSYPIESRESYQKSQDRRAALIRGGI